MSLRVLVVDDDHDVADSLAMLAEVLGNQVRCVYSGADAIAAIADFNPDVVLMDVGMPRMDGWEAARRIRAFPEFARLTMVAITGFGGRRFEEASEAAGFDKHFEKPVDAERLSEFFGLVENAKARQTSTTPTQAYDRVIAGTETH